MLKALTICPSRERPDRAKQMLASFLATAKYSTLMFILDDDDPCLPEYEKFLKNPHPICFWRVVPRAPTPALFNSCFESLRDYEFYHLTNDDVIYRTPAWDESFIATLYAHRGGIAYGNDLIHAGNLPAMPFISGDIVRALGWLLLPTLKHLYGDIVWKYIGEKLNRLFYHKDVIIEHRHWLKDQLLLDESYKRTNSTETYNHDAEKYRHWVLHQSSQDINRAKSALDM
jgi:hypothetical protein